MDIRAFRKEDLLKFGNREKILDHQLGFAFTMHYICTPGLKLFAYRLTFIFFCYKKGVGWGCKSCKVGQLFHLY